MKMSRKLLAVPMICLSLGLGTAWAAGDGVMALGNGPLASGATTDPNTIVATVNGNAIHNSDIDDYIRDFHLNPQQAANRGAILNDIISRDLVRADAMKKGLNKRPDVVAEMKMAGDAVLLNAAVRDAVMSNPVTEAQIKQEYQKQLPNLQPTEYKARHILVKSEAEAKAIIKQLEKGADFAKLAKEKSSDASAKKGGELGWFIGKQMVPAFTAAVAQLKKGQFTRTPVHTPYGWHIIKLEDTRTAKAPDLKQIEPEMRQYLERQHVADYLKQLRAGAKITIGSQQ